MKKRLILLCNSTIMRYPKGSKSSTSSAIMLCQPWSRIEARILCCRKKKSPLLSSGSCMSLILRFLLCLSLFLWIRLRYAAEGTTSVSSLCNMLTFSKITWQIPADTPGIGAAECRVYCQGTHKRHFQVLLKGRQKFGPGQAGNQLPCETSRYWTSYSISPLVCLRSGYSSVFLR